MARSTSSVPVLVFAGLLATGMTDHVGLTDEVHALPGTSPLIMDEPLHVVMVRGISQFAERSIETSVAAKRGSRNVPLVEEELLRRRAKFAEVVGAVDPRVSPSASMGFRTPYSRVTSEGIQVKSVSWPVMEGVNGEGLLLTPAGEIRAAVIAIPDCSQTPEQYCGLESDIRGGASLPLRLVQSGCLVVVPALISRDDRLSGHPDIRQTNLPHREFIYRMAFELGRHIIGYELQRIRSVVDIMRDGQLLPDDTPIGVCGYGDGGQLAMYLAALDRRIDACLVSGYFDDRTGIWKEPIDRNVWKLLTEFTDPEICQLIVPRSLTIDTRPAPAWEGPQTEHPERRDYAAPGRIPALVGARHDEEVAEVETLYANAKASDRFHAYRDRQDAAENAFFLQLTETKLSNANLPLTTGPMADPLLREERLFAELVRFTQMILHRSDKVRAQRWKNVDRSTVEKWEESSSSLREYVHSEMIGQLSHPTSRLNPRSRRIIDEMTYSGYEILLDVYPSESETEFGVVAGGILLLPKDLSPGERRPVVVCQHGLEGTPMDTVTENRSERAWAAYKGFSAQLVQQGYIVYAPQNPYKGFDDFRVIQRKSNPLGRSLFTYIIEQHRQSLRWLRSLPQVNPEQIAFYGLSYGGKTAVRVPPLLYENGQPGYCLSICSADFNEWIRKNSSSEDRYSYVFTPEYEMFEWNMGHVAGYAELASLMAPRPFMVERGHNDGVAPDEWVAWEYARVRRHYVQLGLGDRTEVEWFDGPHTINGKGTFQFLQRHLPLAIRTTRPVPVLPD